MHDGPRMKHFIVIATLLVGCQDGTDPDLVALFPDGCPAASCNVGPIVSTASALAATITASSWVPLGPHLAGCLPASADVPISGTVSLAGTDVALPAWCANMTSCRQDVRFVLRGAPAGVVCERPEAWFDVTMCEGIIVTEASIRFRTVKLDIHPSSYGDVAPVVEVLPACEAPCAANELACDTSNTCWEEERDYCAYCLGGTNEACACWKNGELAEDGEPCELDVSGDTTVGGSCRAGACELATVVRTSSSSTTIGSTP